MPNDNTHTLLPCPFCGSDGYFHYSDIVRCSKFECDLSYADFGVEAWNTRTPAEPKAEAEEPEIGFHICPNCGHRDEYEILVAEPKAGDWEKELKDGSVYDVFGADPDSITGWHRALYSQGEGFLVGEHPNVRILRDVKIVRALSATRTPAEPKAGDWGRNGKDEIAVRELMNSIVDHAKEGDMEAVGRDQDCVIMSFRRALSSAAIATTNDVSTSDKLVDAPRITEADLDRVFEDVVSQYPLSSDWNVANEMHQQLTTLLRQQGPQRSGDQQGAERKCVYSDNLRHTEGRLLILELLRRQGYAKGGYIKKCKSCGKDAWWMDKRAWTCLECAQHNVNDLLYSITNDPSEPPPFTPTQTEG